MEIGIVGLGRMGANIARRLIAGGHQVVVSNRSRLPIEELAAEGATPAWTYENVVELLESPRAVWLMLPAGETTDEFINFYAERLSPGDVIIEGGNSYYKDSMRRGASLKERGINFVDAGTSGGVWGLKEGYSLMVGGEAEVVERLRPIFETLAPAPDRGWGHVGPAGAGHFTKMVHNGIEYGMMQSFAEGFSILHGKKEFDLDLHQVAEIWREGSVVRSWLLDLAAQALEAEPDLGSIRGYVEDSGEGRWTAAEAIDQGVAAPIITLALQMRFMSREDDSFGNKVLAALRHQFGGHKVLPEKPKG